MTFWLLQMLIVVVFYTLYICTSFDAADHHSLFLRLQHLFLGLHWSGSPISLLGLCSSL